MIHTHYDNLKVSRTAPLEVIKAAYKSLAQKYHPDRNQGDSEAARIMKLLNEAYETLSDPIKRAEHDNWIEQQEKVNNYFENSHVNNSEKFRQSANSNNSSSNNTPPTNRTNVQENKKFAGFWRRLLAFSLDLFISFIIGLLLGVVLAVFLSTSLDENQANGFGMLIWWLYFACMESSKYQATLGKMALGIKVVDLNGNRVSFLRATGRHFSKIVSMMILGIGFLMIAFTKNKQGLHDKISNSFVVNKGFQPQGVIDNKGMSGFIKALIIIAILIPIIGILAAIAIPAYQDKVVRNQVMTELDGISLGMRPVDVTLVKGKASNSSEQPTQTENRSHLYWYFYNPELEHTLMLQFSGNDNESLAVYSICSNQPNRLNIKGISFLEHTREDEIIRKLGQPTNISIRGNGLSKMLSYLPMKIAFEFTQDKITMVCVTDTILSYSDEYSNNKKLNDENNISANSNGESTNYNVAYPINENINNVTTYSTSFDCSKAKSTPENLICNNAELAAADLELAKSVEQARIMVADKKAFTQRLRKQWNYREKNCVNTECLSAWFIYMNNELDKIIQTGKVYTEKPTIASETKLNSTETSSSISSAQLSYSEKSAIELACITERSTGAASYNRCLVAQMEELKYAPRQPNLDRLTYSEKSAIELACITERSTGAASYNRCLVKQVEELKNAPTAPF